MTWIFCTFQVPWTEALRQIVKNCYMHHGRQDLLQVFKEEPTSSVTVQQQQQFSGTMMQTINNPDGSVSIIQIDPGPSQVVTLPDGTQATVVHAVCRFPWLDLLFISHHFLNEYHLFFGNDFGLPLIEQRTFQKKLLDIEMFKNLSILGSKICRGKCMKCISLLDVIDLTKTTGNRF